ncbi:MAG: hypothetical protein J2P15_18200, partial [Micromonosporaceae bacterium]|nr:hypothetical protein [Micromonosporaceae bacterium]
KGTFGTWVLRPTAALLARVGYGYGAPAISDAQRATAQADVRFWGAGLVILADDAPYAADLLTTLVKLFGPGRRVDDVWLWILNPG